MEIAVTIFGSFPSDRFNVICFSLFRWIGWNEPRTTLSILQNFYRKQLITIYWITKFSKICLLGYNCKVHVRIIAYKELPCHVCKNVWNYLVKDKFIALIIRNFCVCQFLVLNFSPGGNSNGLNKNYIHFLSSIIGAVLFFSCIVCDTIFFSCLWYEILFTWETYLQIWWRGGEQ